MPQALSQLWSTLSHLPHTRKTKLMFLEYIRKVGPEEEAPLLDDHS